MALAVVLSFIAFLGSIFSVIGFIYNKISFKRAIDRLAFAYQRDKNKLLNENIRLQEELNELKRKK